MRFEKVLIHIDENTQNVIIKGQEIDFIKELKYQLLCEVL